jgi:hypothetical protein
VVGTLEEAFRLTNHINAPWEENKEISYLVGETHRSTSVGDVVENENGVFWCKMVGWEKIFPGTVDNYLPKSTQG